MTRENKDSLQRIGKGLLFASSDPVWPCWVTATNASEILAEACKNWSASLGVYPHSKLDALKDPSKKQSTRLIKCECEVEDDDKGDELCGYTVRITQKRIDKGGAPWCPIYQEPMIISAPAEKEGSDE